MDAVTIIKAMPKVELHLHLEGAFNFKFLFELVQQSGAHPDIQTVEELRRKFAFRDFEHFIQMWFWKNSFFRKAEHFRDSTFFTLQELAAQNIIYVEAFFSPWDFQTEGLTVQDIIAATIAGKEAAEREYGIRCNLIADLVRDHGAASSPQRLDDITPYLGRVIGIGLGGSESRYPARDFARVFRSARERGFHLVAHAGEAAGAESVWEAVQLLQVERIGHGIRSIEDAALVAYLKTRQIPLEICLSSNLKTGVVASLNEHPLDEFFKQGLLVTINSDDPSMFGATLTDEFLLLKEQLNYSWRDIRQLTLNAVQAAFLTAAEKEQLRDVIERFWLKII